MLKRIDRYKVRAFYESLGKERNLLGLPTRSLEQAEVLIPKMSNGRLIGIGGMTKAYNLVPALFVVVESQFQGKGFGTEIVQSIIAEARRRYDYLTLATFDLEVYKPALKIYANAGFRIMFRKRERLWMCLPFNRRGRLICRILPLLYLLYYSWLGRPFRAIYRIRFGA